MRMKTTTVPCRKQTTIAANFCSTRCEKRATMKMIDYFYASQMVPGWPCRQPAIHRAAHSLPSPILNPRTQHRPQRQARVCDQLCLHQRQSLPNRNHSCRRFQRNAKAPLCCKPRWLIANVLSSGSTKHELLVEGHNLDSPSQRESTRRLSSTIRLTLKSWQKQLSLTPCRAINNRGAVPFVLCAWLMHPYWCKILT